MVGEELDEFERSIVEPVRILDDDDHGFGRGRGDECRHAGVQPAPNELGFEALDFSAMKFALGGGAAVQRAVADRWQQVTGHPLIEAYGLTEASPAVCINPVGSQYNGTIGLPIPSTEISIRNDANQELGIGQEGEDLRIQVALHPQAALG